MEIALKEFAVMSDRAIADMCGVTHPYVSEIRKEQVVTVTTSTTRTGKDGKSYPATKTVRNVLKEGPSLCPACRVLGCFSPYRIPAVYYHAPAEIAGF